MNQVPVMSEAAPWPSREAPASSIEFARTYKPESCDDVLRFDPGVVFRLEKKLSLAKQQLNVFARRAAERKNAEALDAQLRANEVADIERFEKALAKYNAIRPQSLPTPISEARKQLVEAVKDFYQTSRSDGGGRVVVAFSMNVLDICQYDTTEIGDFTTGNSSLLYCQGLFGMNFGRTVADVVVHARRMNGRPISSVRNGDL